MNSGTVFELITMGRIGVDLYPEQIGVPLSAVSSFGKFLGGSPTNVAVAASRLGRASAVITKVGADGFGLYIKDALKRFGVDGRWVGTESRLRTPITFCEIYPPDNFPLLFYRQPSAPDLQLRTEELDLGAIASAKVFWTTGTGLSEEPSRSATLDALEARPPDAITVHDIDYRPMFWPSARTAGLWAREALRYSTVAVGNQDEVEMAVGTRDPMDSSAALLDIGVKLAIVKQGPAGVLARTVEEVVEVPPMQIRVLNGLGAGDAFGGALCHGLLSGWDLERVVRFANAAGAIVASRLACADAMPAVGEIDELVERGISVP